jgi:hypothetical protein
VPAAPPAEVKKEFSEADYEQHLAGKRLKVTSGERRVLAALLAALLTALLTAFLTALSTALLTDLSTALLAAPLGCGRCRPSGWRSTCASSCR